MSLDRLPTPYARPPTMLDVADNALPPAAAALCATLDAAPNRLPAMLAAPPAMPPAAPPMSPTRLPTEPNPLATVFAIDDPRLPAIPEAMLPMEPSIPDATEPADYPRFPTALAALLNRFEVIPLVLVSMSEAIFVTLPTIYDAVYAVPETRLLRPLPDDGFRILLVAAAATFVTSAPNPSADLTALVAATPQFPRIEFMESVAVLVSELARFAV